MFTAQHQDELTKNLLTNVAHGYKRDKGASTNIKLALAGIRV